MSDYIKREDALKAVNGIHEDDLPRNNKIEVCDVLTLVVPSADVVQVVRCKDCKHCEYASNRTPTEQAWVCYKLGIDVEQDWFCADGERKDNE